MDAILAFKAFAVLFDLSTLHWVVALILKIQVSVIIFASLSNKTIKVVGTVNILHKTFIKLKSFVSTHAAYKMRPIVPKLISYHIIRYLI